MIPKKFMPGTIMLILIGIAFFFLFLSGLGAYISIRPPKIISKITPEDLGLNYEEVSFITKDKLTLRGWFIPQQKKGVPVDEVDRGSSISQSDIGTKTIILLHGYPADKGDILPALSFLNEIYNLFLFDFRYLGRSEGKYSTAGAKETEDLLAAIRFLKPRGTEEVGVWGFSMGGAVALMATSKAPEIKVIVSESSYASLDLMALELYRIPVLRYPMGYLTRLWAKIFLGIDIKKISPMESAKDLAIPVLIIHSTNDDVIPFSHALFIKKALRNNPRAEFWFSENLFHGQLGEEYQKRIGDFFKRNL